MKKILILLVMFLLISTSVYADDVSIDSQGNVTTGVSNSAANFEVTGSDEDGIVGTTTGTGKAGVYGGHSSGNYGLLGDDQYGVYGESAGGEAGHFQGDATVTGDLTVGGALNATVGNTDTVDGKHAADLLDKATYDTDADGKVNSAVTADTATNADTVDSKHASEFMEKALYDVDGNGKPDRADDADTAQEATHADMVDGQHASDIISAAADEVRIPIDACGTAITAAGSYYLTGNINVTSGICIDVSVSNVTIDLMGFTVTGLGGTGADHGIYIHGASNVEIKNGTLREFTQGIWAAGTSNTSIRVINVRALQNKNAGIYVSPGNSKIMNCVVDWNGTGIYIYDSSTVADNKVYNSASYGIHVAGTSNSIEGNHIVDSGYGIYFESTGNYSYDNRLSGNTTDYFRARLQQGNDINEIRSCGTTISSSGSYYVTGNLSTTGHCITVTANDVTIDLKGFTLSGDASGTDYGVYINDVSNVEVKNGTLTGFYDGIYAYNTGSNSSNRVINVRAMGNTNNGLRIYGNASSIQDCTAGGNGLAGIQAGVGASIINNTAYNNQSYGIYASDGSIIMNNTVYGNQTDGIYAKKGSAVTNNTVYANQRYGIYAEARVTVANNVAIDNNSFGIVAVDTGCKVTGNTISGNNTSNTVNEGGLYLFSDALAKGNSLSGNLKNNIYVYLNDNVIEENLITDSTNGIYFNSSGNFYANNRASGNTTNYANTTGNTDGGGNVSF